MALTNVPTNNKSAECPKNETEKEASTPLLEDYYEEMKPWEYVEECCCDFDHGSEDWCPQCCPYEGVFSGGTEDCEFCQYADWCRESLEGEK